MSHFEDHGLQAVQTGLPVLLPVTGSITVNPQISCFRNPSRIGRDQFLDQFRRKRRVLSNPPRELRLGIDFVDVLSPRAGAADVRPLQFRRRNPESLIDPQSGFSNRHVSAGLYPFRPSLPIIADPQWPFNPAPQGPAGFALAEGGGSDELTGVRASKPAGFRGAASESL